MTRINLIKTDSKGMSFPCLMKLNDKNLHLVVLFFSLKCGFVVESQDSGCKVGDFHHAWEPCNNQKTWLPIFGKVEIFCE